MRPARYFFVIQLSNSRVSLRPEPGEVLLGKNWFGILSFEAYICKKCKKVLFDYSKSNFEEA